jgi:hypothetical protein
MVERLEKMINPELSPLTNNQWRSVALNSVFAFLSAFLPIVVASDNLDKAVIGGAVVAGFMAVFKVIEKALKDE